jgi:predicted PurR-regulated permease PerM
MEKRGVQVINLIPGILFAFGVFILWGAISSLAQPLLLIALAMIIAAGLNPLVIWANTKLRMPRALGAAIILFVLLGGTFLLIWSLVPALISQISSLVSSLPGGLQKVQEWLTGLSANSPLLKNLTSGVNSSDVSKQLTGALSSLPGTLLGALGATTGLLNNLLLGALLLIMGFTVLIDPTPLIRGALAGVPVHYRDDVSRAMVRIGAQLGGWLFATLILSVAMTILVFIGLSVLNLFGVQVENIFLFAVIAGVTQVIPVIGGLFGLIPPVLTSLSPTPIHALWVGIVVFAVQQVVFNLISPIVFSSRVSLHPASLLAGVLIFSGLFGFVGAFLAVPFLIIIKSIYEELYLPSLGSSRVSLQEAEDLIQGRALEEATPEMVSVDIQTEERA